MAYGMSSRPGVVSPRVAKLTYENKVILWLTAPGSKIEGDWRTGEGYGMEFFQLFLARFNTLVKEVFWLIEETGPPQNLVLCTMVPGTMIIIFPRRKANRWRFKRRRRDWLLQRDASHSGDQRGPTYKKAKNTKYTSLSP